MHSGQDADAVQLNQLWSEIGHDFHRARLALQFSELGSTNAPSDVSTISKAC